MKRTKPKPRPASKYARAAPKIEQPELPQETIHRLKSVPDTFDPIESGERTFDIRLDDRGFKIGDLVQFVRWDEARQMAGRTVRKRIVYLLYGLEDSSCHPLTKPRWGLKARYVIMSLANLT